MGHRGVLAQQGSEFDDTGLVELTRLALRVEDGSVGTSRSLGISADQSCMRITKTSASSTAK